MTVFDTFVETPYTFLTITRGNVYGNQITSESNYTGVFKLRSDSNSSNNIEIRESRATLHAHPEDYSEYTYADLVGQGIRYNGVDYEISSVTGGMNYQTGIMEHLTFTLERAEYAS